MNILSKQWKSWSDCLSDQDLQCLVKHPCLTEYFWKIRQNMDTSNEKTDSINVRKLRQLNSLAWQNSLVDEILSKILQYLQNCYDASAEETAVILFVFYKIEKILKLNIFLIIKMKTRKFQVCSKRNNNTDIKESSVKIQIKKWKNEKKIIAVVKTRYCNVLKYWDS